MLVLLGETQIRPSEAAMCTPTTRWWGAFGGVTSVLGATGQDAGQPVPNTSEYIKSAPFSR